MCSCGGENERRGSLLVKKGGVSSSSSSRGDCLGVGVGAGAGAGVCAFLEIVRVFFEGGCSSRARSGESASVVERSRRLLVEGVGATASGRVAGCALALARDTAASLVDFAAFGAAALRGARVRLLRVSTVMISSVTSVVAAARVERRVAIAAAVKVSRRMRVQVQVQVTYNAVAIVTRSLGLSVSVSCGCRSFQRCCCCGACALCES